MQIASIIASVADGAIRLYARFTAAKPMIVEHTSYYDIHGQTFDELKEQLNAKGPPGTWAATRWRIDRVPGCPLRIEINHITPRWVDRSQAPADVQKTWVAMVAKLNSHQRRCAMHARQAALEIATLRCGASSEKIVRKWTSRDRDHGLAMMHGLGQGLSQMA